MLLFTVFDWDLVKKDDFAGMCIVPCSDIPRLQGTGAEQQRAMILEVDAPQRKVFRYHFFILPEKQHHPFGLSWNPELNLVTRKQSRLLKPYHHQIEVKYVH
jgi:hypothetical protein